MLRVRQSLRAQQRTRELGERVGGHFDHDAKRMSGLPPETVLAGGVPLRSEEGELTRYVGTEHPQTGAVTVRLRDTLPAVVSALAEATHFLVLRRTGDGRHVHFFGRFADAIRDWRVGDRISPIYSFDVAAPPHTTKLKWLLFTGPVDPAELSSGSSEALPRRFLTLGLYNVLFVAENATERKQAMRWVEQRDLAWEMWKLKGDRIETPAYRSVTPRDAGDETLKRNLIGVVDKPAHRSLIPTSREFAATVIATESKSHALLPKDVTDSLALFAKCMGDILSDFTVTPLTKHAYLVNANAALSRFSSQTFSGVTPIAETECHFWTHSLLGAGIGTLALYRLSAHVVRAFVDERLVDRLEALAKLRPYPKALFSYDTRDIFWDTAHLDSREVDLELAEGRDLDPILPLIPHFSGRDGFKSTHVSLSVPIECIDSCNSIAWTLQTITHELCHNLTDGALGVLLPRSSDEASIARVVSLLKPQNGGAPVEAVTRLEQLTVYLCWNLLMLNQGDLDPRVGQSLLIDAIEKQDRDINELITHVLDFLYSYRREPDHYIRAVWASWGVIPHVLPRVHQYLLRTLCAIHSLDCSREAGVEATIDRAYEVLVKIRDTNELCERACALLETRRAELVRDLSRRAGIVRFVRAFLFQARVSVALFADAGTRGGGEHDGYDLTPGDFSGGTIESPLRFVVGYSKSAEQSSARAAWMLHKLAFSSARPP